MKKNNEYYELDLLRLLQALWQRLGVLILAGIIGAVVLFVGTYYLISPKYESSAMFYVNNNSLSVGDTSFSISSSDITASKSLVDSYIVILNTRETLNDVIDYSGVDYSYKTVRDMISASSVNETEIFEVVVTSTDAEEAEAIASAIAYILPKRISDIIEGTSAKIVDTAVIPGTPSSPSLSGNAMIGFMLGFLISVAMVVLRVVLDIRIRSEEDISRGCNHPVLAAVPNMSVEAKGGYYYGAYGKSAAKKPGHKKEQPVVGKRISFTASEAYKLLRTKLQFSFTDDSRCRVIGVSSALAGEGKSVTAVNVAYSLSQLDKKVLLIDCDMRRPSLAEKLGIKRVPGLSSCLTGQNKWSELLQPCGIAEDQDAFSVIVAGRNPPNPIELLSSQKMVTVLQQMREEYDYIILDLPPVAEVSDAMAVATETDGILLVVRQDYCDHIALSGAAREFEFVGAKILGVVFNCTVDQASGYGKKYYKRYYRRYYGRYHGRYVSERSKPVDAEANGAEQDD